MNWSLLRKFGKRIRALRPLPAVAPRGRRVLALEYLEGRDLPAAPPLQFFYSPLPENDIRLAEAALGATPDNTMVSITSFTASANNTIVYYDQWEDGYEADLANPVQSTTEIWGDGNPANGSAPGLAGDIIKAGDVMTIRDSVAVNPRVPAAGPIPIFYDGGDKIGASSSLAMTRAMWNNSVDTVLAHSVGVFDTRYAGTSFTAAVGTNTASPGQQFEYSTLFIQATQDNTNVMVDVNGDGTLIETKSLNQGQSYVTTNTVKHGAKVTASRPVQVFEFTGDVGARFESRMYNVFPDARLSNDYYSPVFSTTGNNGGTATPVNVQIFVHNPGAAAITVNVETTGGTQALTVPARSTVASGNIPNGSAAHVYSAGGQNFSAVFVNDAGADGSIWDWGSTLQPTNQLSPIAVLAWAPGDRNTPTPLNNYSAVWLTAVANTTVYVDYDGDPATGPNVDAFGNRYDTTLALSRLQAVQLTDPNDRDMSRMRLYTLDGTNISVAWGENAAVALTGAPAMDLGTTVPAFPVPFFSKTVRLLTDANGDGSINSGDTLRYTLTVQNSGVFPITNAVVLDTLPVQLQYVPGTARIDGTPLADSGTTPFPLDETGYTVVNLNIGQTTVITFDTLVKPSLASGTTTVTNAGSVSVGITIVQDQVTSDVRGAIGDTVYNDRNRNGTQDPGEPGLGNVTLSLYRDSNGNGTFDPATDALVATKTTDVNGRYVFGNLDEATYFVRVTDTNGVVTGTTPTAGGSPRTVVVGAGAAIADADFGFAFPTDLVVTKTGPASVVPGTDLTYTITVSNAGQSSALGVSVTDALPAGTTFVSLSQSGSTTFTPTTPAVGTTGTVTLTAADLPVGASVTFTLVAHVGPGVTTTLSNTATGTTTTPESNTGNNSGTATTPVTPRVDLSITNDDGVTQYVAGSGLTYTIVVTNRGPSDVTGATVKDILPAALTGATWTAAYSPGAGGTPGGLGDINATVNLPVNGTATFTLSAVVSPTATGTLTTTATVAAPAGVTDTDLSNNSADDTDAPGGTPDLTLSKTDGRAAAAPGDALVYTLTYQNVGTRGATGVVMTETLPTGTTFDPRASTGTWVNIGGGVYTQTIGAVAAGSGGSVAFAVTVNAAVAAGQTQVVNDASIGDDGLNGSDPTPLDNAAEDTDALNAAPDLAVAKSDGVRTARPGDVLTYTVTVTNNGNQDATGVVLTDTLPANTSFVSATGGGSPSASTVTWTVGNLAAGASVSFTVTVQVAATVPAGAASLTNSATADDDGTNGPDPTPLDNTGTDTDTLDAAPDLVVTKTDGTTGTTPGSSLTYTITVRNVGNQDATGVMLTDTLPADTTFAGASGGGSPSGGTVTWSIGNLAAGATATRTVTVTVNAAVPAGATSLRNSAHADDDGTNGPDPTPLDNTGTDTDALTAAPDLTLTITDGVTTATPGDTLTYTLTYANVGDQGATGVVITETLPAGTTLNPAANPGWVAQGGGTFTFAVGNLSAGAGGTAAFVVTVNSPAAAGQAQVFDPASIADDGSNGPDPTPLNNTDSDTDTLVAAPDLVVTKTDSVTTAAPGDTLTYTITVRNAGNQDATGVTLTDALPVNTTFVSATGGGSPSGATVNWTVGNLAAGASVSFTVMVQVAATVPAGAASLTNSATADDDGTNGPDPTPLDNTGTDTDTLDAAPDLVVTKTDGTTGATPGGTLTYTITVRNVGNQGATGVVLTDTLPTNTTFAGASGGGSESGGVVTWSIGNLAAGATATRTVTVTVNATVPAGATSLTNAAHADDDGANGPDPTPLDNTGTDTDTLVATPDLTLTKTDGVTTTTPGGTLTYTLRYANAGNQDATGVVLTETLPAGTTFVPAGSPGWVDQGGGTFTFAVGNLAAGASGTATFVVTVTSPAAAGQTTVFNTASVGDDGTNGTDPNPADNTTTDTDALDATPDLVVTVTDGGVTVQPGGTVTYTITVTNVGDQDATGVTLTSPVPTYTTFTSASSGGSASGGIVTWAIGNVAVGATVTRTLTVTVDATVPAGVNSVTDTAHADDDGSNGPDPTPLNNTASDPTPLIAAPDLVVTKTDGVTSAKPGDTLAYTITVANTGNSGATGVVLSDTIPANTTFVSAAGGSFAGGVVTWAVGGLTAGASTSFTVTVQVNAAVPAGATSLFNAAHADDDGTNGPDPNPGDNTGTDTDTLTAAPDLTLTITDGVTTTTPGDTLTYTLTYANVGDQGATGVVITETLPAGTTFAPAANPGWVVQGGGVYTFAVGNLAAGASGTATFVVTVTSPAAAGQTTVFNTASVADDGTNGPDPTPLNNADSDTDTLAAAPDLVVTKTDGTTGTTPGGTLTYTITVTNTGNQDATGVTLTDPIPANTAFASASNGGTPTGGVVTWSIGNLAAGTSVTRTVTLTVNATVPSGVTSLTNSATANDDGTNGPDPTPNDNTGTDTDALTAAPDLVLTKTDGVANTTPGATLTYTLSYSNAGNQGATGVVLTETLPAGTTFSAAANPGWVAQGGGTFTFAVGNLAAGASGAAMFVVTVTAPAVAGQAQVFNTASVGDDGTNGTDPNPADNTATDTDTLDAAPDLVVTKSDGATSVRPGDTLTYTITVTNNGNQDATGVTLTDTIPALTGFVTASGRGTFANGTVTWTVGNLAAGASVSFTVTVKVADTVPAGVGSLTNSANATDDGTNGPDPNPTDNTGTDTDTLDAAPDLTLTKTDGLTVVIPGSSVVYTLRYANAGNQDATGVNLTETLPAGTTFDASRSAAGWVNQGNGTFTFAVGNLAAGANGTATFAVTVNKPAPAGQAMVMNSALVTDDGTNGKDPNPGDNTGTDADALNRLPVAVDDTTATTQDVPVTVPNTTLLANDDQGDAPASVIAVSPASTAGGTVVLGPNGVVYTPPANFQGIDTFTYTIRDQNGDTSAATVTVTIVPLGQAGGADGRVWLDFDADGKQDADEPGIAGVTLTLTRAGRDNDFATTADNQTFTTVTGPTGGYSFGTLPFGLYRVAVTGGLPAGASLTFDPDAAADGRTDFTLADGQKRGGLDFGYRGQSRLTGTVFADYQVNGVFDPTAPTPEVGVPGITVTLTGTDAAGNAITRTAVSAADGSFAFGGLLAGTYTLTETPPPPVTQPGGYYDGLESAGTTGGTVRSNVVSSIQLGTSVNGDGYGFGVNPPADPFGFVYIDRNQNGRRDPGEVGIPGVTITVSGVAFAGTPLAHTLTEADVPGGLIATTDANGRWEFRIIPPGTYTFREAQPAGYIDGPEENADPRGPFTVVVGNDAFSNVVLTPTPVRGPFNFGELPQLAPGGAIPPMDFFPAAPIDPSKRMFLGSTTTPRAFDTTSSTDPTFAAFNPSAARPAAFLATAEDAGGGWVRVFDFASGTERFRLQPFGDFTGGVRVAVADVTGDGIPDLIAAAGPGGGPVVKVIDGNTGAEVGSVMAFEAGFRGGLRVAAGDVNGDGFADVVITPDVGGGPIVRVLDGRTLNPVANFFALDETFRGGLRIAAGDVNRDGAADLVVTAGVGGGPRVAVYDGRSLSGTPARVGNDFFGFAPELRNGFWVSAGDVDGDGYADIVLGAGDGGGERAVVYSGRGLATGGGAAEIANVLAGGESSRSGAQVAAVDLDGDGKAELAAAGGSGADAMVYLLDPLTGRTRDEFRAFPSTATGGVSLG